MARSFTRLSVGDTRSNQRAALEAASHCVLLAAASLSLLRSALFATPAVEGEMYHELLGLCINRGKLYRVTAVTSNKKWGKRKRSTHCVLCADPG